MGVVGCFVVVSGILIQGMVAKVLKANSEYFRLISVFWLEL